MVNGTFIRYLAIAFTVFVCPAFAEDITEPTEVGTTTMPPGQYTVIEKSSSRTYSLMVTKKGNMILSPEKSVASAPANTTADGSQNAATGAATTVTAPTANQGTSPAAATGQPQGSPGQKVQSNVERGINRLLNSGDVKKELQKILK